MAAQSVATILKDHVKLSVECIDRMYLNVYVPALQIDRGMAWCFRGHRRQPVASSALAAAATFWAAARASTRPTMATRPCGVRDAR